MKNLLEEFVHFLIQDLTLIHGEGLLLIEFEFFTLYMPIHWKDII